MMADYAELCKRLRGAAKLEKYYNASGKLFDDAADAIEELLDELTTIRKQLPRWISVEELLPPVYKVVLSCDKYGLVKENYMISDKDWSVGYHITHWMPLPAPPKEVE